jgi:hypothetical protein
VTENDATTEGMLALNTRLGYASCTTRSGISQSGKHRRCSAGRTCAVTHTGVVTYRRE